MHGSDFAITSPTNPYCHIIRKGTKGKSKRIHEEKKDYRQNNFTLIVTVTACYTGQANSLFYDFDD